MPTVQNVSLGGGQVAPQQKITTLTSAQIQALGSTPIAIVPAPGAGFVLAPISVFLLYDFGSVAYQTTSGADTLTIKYGGAVATLVTATVLNLITAAQSQLALRPIAAGVGNVNPGNDNQTIVISAANNYGKGAIATTTLNAAGTGYAVNDTGTITQGANDATYTITSIGAGGSVTGYTITSPGTQYTVANGVATATGGAQPGVGTGFKVNITAVTTGDGTLKVVTNYNLITVP